MKKQTLKVSTLRISIIFLFMYLILQLIFMATLGFFISFEPLEIDWVPFAVYTPALLVLTLIFYILSIKKTYYEVDEKSIVYYRNNKIYEFPFKKMLYIDEKWSKSHKTLLFYDESGKRKYLTFDKKGIIFEYALKYSPSLSREEFLKRFPNAKL